ncbi:MAG: hypothetical protein ABEN55_03895 [Bradymonadaceae bacterium]
MGYHSTHRLSQETGAPHTYIEHWIDPTSATDLPDDGELDEMVHQLCCFEPYPYEHDIDIVVEGSESYTCTRTVERRHVSPVDFRDRQIREGNRQKGRLESLVDIEGEPAVVSDEASSPLYWILDAFWTERIVFKRTLLPELNQDDATSHT